MAYVTRVGGGTFKLCAGTWTQAGPADIDTSDDGEPKASPPNGKLIVYATRAGGHRTS